MEGQGQAQSLPMPPQGGRRVHGRVHGGHWGGRDRRHSPMRQIDHFIAKGLGGDSPAPVKLLRLCALYAGLIVLLLLVIMGLMGAKPA